MANPWIENKGRKRAPFKAGTLIDVQMRSDRNESGVVEQIGVTCGYVIDDWAIDNCNGDVLHYRLHEETKDEQE